MEMMLNKTQVAQMLGVSLRTLARWLEQGEGPTFRTTPGGRLLRCSREDLEDWIHRLPERKP